MGDVIRFKPGSVRERARSSTLCLRDFHKWVVVKEKTFDVKQGKLVTTYECARCGKTRTTAH